MKRNIYSYSKLWMILFVLMGTACTNQVEDAIPVSGQPIGFSVQSDWKEIPNTRLLIDDNGTMKFIQGDKVQIFGFHKSSQWAVENVQFMYDVDNHVDNRTLGQKVEFDGTNWNYTPKRFWPKEGLLDFYASYPCNTYNSIHYDVEKKMMTYENNLTQDLLYGLATDRDCASKRLVEIWMVHALAKVKIILDKSLGDIGTVQVSGYKAGHFYYTIDGVPAWDIDDVNTHIDATFHKYPYNGYEADEELKNNNSVTVFILPENITGLQMWDDHNPGNWIEASTEISNRIKNLKFEAGNAYEVTISKGVRKKNTNSRSIAMSVRRVSE